MEGPEIKKERPRILGNYYKFEPKHTMKNER